MVNSSWFGFCYVVGTVVHKQSQANLTGVRGYVIKDPDTRKTGKGEKEIAAAQGDVIARRMLKVLKWIKIMRRGNPPCSDG